MPSKSTNSATTIKFLSLPIGERFRWQGALYIKTSPLIAHDEASNKTQLIQRAALVEPLDAQAVARTTQAANASQAVLEKYHRIVLSGLDSLAANVPAQHITELRKKFDAAYRHARKQLEKKK
jgi:hypothetical protein